MRLVPFQFAAFALAASLSSVCADAPIARSPELQVLDRFIGNWKTEITIKGAGEKYTTTESRRWSRAGKFIISEDMNEAAKKEAHFLITYDPAAKVYRACFIDEVTVLTLTGTWDNDKQTMKWEGNDPGAGTKSTGNYRFVDKDNVEWSMVINGSDGKAVVELSAKQTRVK